MSWDVLLLRLPQGVTAIDEIPDDHSEPLGPREEVLAAIAKATPAANLSDPTWGVLNHQDWSIELNIGSTEPVDSVMLHVRGGGDVDVAIFTLANALGCAALDCSSGDLLTPEDSGDGWREFQEYRDRVLGGG